MYQNAHIPDPNRIKLDEGILDKFFKEIFRGKVPELAVEKHLPYSLVYNVVKGRIKSLSPKEYRILFGQEPLHQGENRVEGTYFRGMVDLWIFLNGDATKSSLYKEFYPDKRVRQVDYRIFNGEVKTVRARLEKIMEQKFFDQGFDESEIRDGIVEIGHIPDEERVSYEYVKPLLEYLKKHLKMSPARLLRGRRARYEKGELKTVSRRLYNYMLLLRKETEKALHSGSRAEIERLRERTSGKRRGLTLYIDVQEEIEFLRTHGEKGIKRYLGRSAKNYEESRLKRVATWRAEKIRADCNELINNNPEIPIQAIPRPHRKARLGRLISSLKSFLVYKMEQRESIMYEKQVLTPSFYKGVRYGTETDALTSMDRASHVLEMSKKAFDLMVAHNREIFKRIGRYDGKWRLPTSYLQGLLEKQGFDLVKEKYEILSASC
jgi:hypothetical protein